MRVSDSSVVRRRNGNFFLKRLKRETISGRPAATATPVAAGLSRHDKTGGVKLPLQSDGQPGSDSQMVTALVSHHRGKFIAAGLFIAAILILGGCAIYRMDISTRQAKEIGSKRWFNSLQSAWLPHGKGLLRFKLSDHHHRPGGRCTHIYPADADGGGLKQLTSGAYDVRPACSPDGKWVVYSSGTSGRMNLWKISIDGGKPVQLTNAAVANNPSISPDGKWIACLYKQSPQTPDEFAILPFEGGKPVKTFQAPPRGAGWNWPVWMPGGRSIAYQVEKDSVPNIMEQSIAGGPPRPLTHYTSGQVLWVAVSRDGQLAIARGTQSSDVVLIRNFQ